MSASRDHSPPAPSHPSGGVAIVPLGLTLSLFLSGNFVLCALAGFLPGMENLHFLSALYPALDWTSPALIIAGAAWAFACGWYIALVCGWLYNAFAAPRA
jgi:hypothetical protein